MKIIVVNSVGYSGRTGIQKQISRVELEVPGDSKIIDIWQQAEMAVGQETFCNRYEVTCVDGKPSVSAYISSHIPESEKKTGCVPSFFTLHDGDILYLVHVP